ncbi:sigma-54-dependent Fis family transcriptional regulator, partial [Vibrio cholerae]|nr:sigma-54-dependent Fis family transcriptional regulator [Vibrio cholerae]
MSPVLDLNQTHLYQAFSVLVVDDEVGMQLVLKKALSKWFSRVDLAGSIEDAEVL